MDTGKSGKWKNSPVEIFPGFSFLLWTSLVAQTVRSLLAMWGDLSSIPGLGRSPGGGNGNLL